MTEPFEAYLICIYSCSFRRIQCVPGMYYRRKRKPSDPFNNLSLTANTIRSWGCGSVTEEWDSLYAQKVQLFTFLSTLPEPALSYGPSVKTNMANSIE
uniref:Uncharacterized protein n=1 Tax=Aegilops tauschii subsp. strangulata TaxID=200361 RepID=A0A453LDI1_AEGTS